MIILEDLEAPTTLKEQIAASRAEVKRLDRLSLNATGHILLCFPLTVVAAVSSACLVEQLGILQIFGIVPPAIVGGLSLWWSFRRFDQRSAVHHAEERRLKELEGQLKTLKRLESRSSES